MKKEQEKKTCVSGSRNKFVVQSHVSSWLKPVVAVVHLKQQDDDDDVPLVDLQSVDKILVDLHFSRYSPRRNYIKNSWELNQKFLDPKIASQS